MAYCTTANVKAYLGISGSGDDTLIDSLVIRAQQVIDTYCNRTFEAAENSNRYFDAYADVESKTLYLDADLCSINSITNGDGVTVTTSEYVTEPRNDAPFYAITLKPSSAKSWEPNSDGDSENAITISGKWAWSAAAPADIVQACVRLTAFMYRQKDAQMTDVQVLDGGVSVTPLAIPNDVKAILTPYRRL